MLRVPGLVAVARIPVALIGIPLALLASIYGGLVPWGEEPMVRYMRLIICKLWPFSLDYWRFYVRSSPVDSPDAEWRYYQLERAGQIAKMPLPPMGDWRV